MRWWRLIGVGTVLLAACSGSGDASVDSTTTTAATTTTLPDAGFTEVSTTAPPEPAFVDGPLAEVCPAEIVIQLGGPASVEHGPLFELLAANVSIDEARQSLRASLRRADGTVEGVTLEIRFGGAAVDFRAPLELLASDQSITMAEVSTADLVLARPDVAATAVVTLTERSHQGVVWDPSVYPDAADITELAAAGPEIRHLPDEPFIDYLGEIGALAGATLVDEPFVGPAAFVAANGVIAQQAEALVEPLLLPTLPQWDRPVEFGFAADVGWEAYDDALAVRSGEIDDLQPCLGRLVPIVQQATVAYATEPGDMAGVIGGLRELFNPLTRATPELLEAGVASALGNGVIANAPGGAIGAFDEERTDRFATALAATFALTVGDDDLTTNLFIDATISL